MRLRSNNDYGDEDDLDAGAALSYDITRESIDLEMTQLLNKMSVLRASSGDEYMDLPQVVVCGDQSSGKSSVLAALTGIPFPTDSLRCTRYTTQIRLRRGDQVRIEISIIPDPDSTAEERQRLSGFKQTMGKDANVETVFRRATELIFPLGRASNFLTKHILNFQVSGPKQPYLTIVDLPGLISADVEEAENDRMAAVDLARFYMEKEHTLILPVVSCSNDLSNQAVLQMAKDIDINGTRTLGIITKPDMALTVERELDFIKLASNKRKRNKLPLGWHVMRNKAYNERHFTAEQRNQSEMEFFADSSWGRELGADQLGAEALSKRLSALLVSHVAELIKHRLRFEDPPEASSSARETQECNIQNAIQRHNQLADHSVREASARQLYSFTLSQSFILQSRNSEYQECRLCTIIFFLWILLAAGSLTVGLWRSFATGDEGKGFTDAAYIVAVGGLVVFPVQARHNKRCRQRADV